MRGHNCWCGSVTRSSPRGELPPAIYRSKVSVMGAGDGKARFRRRPTVNVLLVAFGTFIGLAYALFVIGVVVGLLLAFAHWGGG